MAGIGSRATPKVLHPHPRRSRRSRGIRELVDPSSERSRSHPQETIVTRNELPAEAVAWLAAAEQALRHASAEQTTEIMDGLRSHITEALARGEAVDEVLMRLGPPADVPDPVLEDIPGRRPDIKPAQVVDHSAATSGDQGLYDCKAHSADHQFRPGAPGGSNYLAAHGICRLHH